MNGITCSIRVVTACYHYSSVPAVEGIERLLAAKTNDGNNGKSKSGKQNQKAVWVAGYGWKVPGGGGGTDMASPPAGQYGGVLEVRLRSFMRRTSYIIVSSLSLRPSPFPSPPATLPPPPPPRPAPPPSPSLTSVLSPSPSPYMKDPRTAAELQDDLKGLLSLLRQNRHHNGSQWTSEWKQLSNQLQRA